ncbi:arginine--tRNA ligase, partial [Patescibacteria group bacterium]|nr:arginine--tRNA ligase [Patescibacteria group bacterium]
QKENFGKNNLLKGEKVIVEYTDPNPFKEFHIGHLMSNTIGEAISRVIEASGAEVKRACYQGDVGLHIAKAIWWMQKQDSKPEDIATPVLAVAYKWGDQAYRESEKDKKEIEEINKKIYEKDPEIYEKYYLPGRKVSLDYFETIYKKLGTKFDYYFFESETGVLGKNIVEKYVGEVFEKSDGAVVFRGEHFKPSLHTRVFVNKEGLPTYEAKELGLAKIKYNTYPYTNSIVITGNEVNDYFKVLLEAMEQIFPDLAEKTKHISHGMLRLPTGKMSSRTGDVITAESLLSEISEKVIEKVKETNRGDMSDEFINQVSVAALKYSILKQTIGGDIIYDFDKSISFEGDSGPYLQYSYARARSILEKALEEKVISSEHGYFSAEKFLVLAPSHSQVSAETTFSSSSTLERLMYRFPEIVLRSVKEFQPHHITNYLIELARAYNTFYGNTKIIDKDDANSSYRIALTEVFSIIMKNGLNILGIQVPEKM